MKYHDVAVIGLGAMGSAACWQLAERGADVIGFEQFRIPHDRGSYSGHTRAFRLAYFEHPDYVPLLKRAYDGWKNLERVTGESIFIETGGLYVGLPDSPLIVGSLAAAQEHEIPCEALTRDDLCQRYPQFKVPEAFVGMFEPRGGILLSEKIVEASCEHARACGATICDGERVRTIQWSGDTRQIQITTDVQTITVERVIICAGAWTTKLLGEIGLPLRVSRQVLGWFTPPDTRAREMYEAPTMPMWGWDDPDGVFRYGFPIMPGRMGMKISHHNPGETIDIDTFDRTPTDAEGATLAGSFGRVFGRCSATRTIALHTCIYTNTPDEHFIVDTHPANDSVIIAAGFSGHGFKFASVMGDLLADLALHGRTDLPIDFLSLKRLTAS